MAARGAGANLSGRIRICAAVTFARLHVVPRLGAFLAEYPSLDVDIILDDRNTDLIEGGIDIALRMGQLTDFEPDRQETGPVQKIGSWRAVLFGNRR